MPSSTGSTSHQKWKARISLNLAFHFPIDHQHYEIQKLQQIAQDRFDSGLEERSAKKNLINSVKSGSSRRIRLAVAQRAISRAASVDTPLGGVNLSAPRIGFLYFCSRVGKDVLRPSTWCRWRIEPPGNNQLQEPYRNTIDSVRQQSAAQQRQGWRLRFF